MMQESLFTRSNGQIVAYFDYGQSDDVVFWHHGTPMAGPIYPNLKAKADENRFRIIEIVRSGYGSSTANPDRSVNSLSKINLEVADALGIEKFAMYGNSGGGPHALAAGHLSGSRCLAQLVISSLAPVDDANYDFLDGMSDENREWWSLLRNDMGSFEAKLSAEATNMATYTFDQIKEMLEGDPENPISDEYILNFLARLEYSFTQGSAGLKEDQLAFGKPWEFLLTEISSPVQLWAGMKDVDVPPAHARYLNRMIPNSDLHVIPDKNHDTISKPAIESGFAWLRQIFDSQF